MSSAAEHNPAVRRRVIVSISEAPIGGAAGERTNPWSRCMPRLYER